MRHGDLVRAILGRCAELGLFAHYCRDGRHCEGAGFPDLVIAGPGGVLYREVKGRDGVLRPEQGAWGFTLQIGGGDWKVWRPVHWSWGTVDQELRLLAQLDAPGRCDI